MKVLILGTSSDAGKTVTCAMICRYLSRRGMDPAPFKASNLSLNSYATVDGGEIGIGQAFQAWACGIEPGSDMNPVLLKPSGDGRLQVVLGGRPYADVGCGERLDRDVARRQIAESYARLSEEHGAVVCEGSGSPAELNLMSRDLANTGLMRQLGVPAVLVGDIERGGVFAALYGTWRLVPDDVRPLLKGFVINRFRGDPSILGDGIEEIERRTGMKCLGVLPYMDLRFPEEDSLSRSEGALEGDDPREAFLSNVDRLLDAAEEAGFDFEALIGIASRRSSARSDPDGPDLVGIGGHGIHRNGPTADDEEIRPGDQSGGPGGGLDCRTRRDLDVRIRRMDHCHCIAATIAPPPINLAMVRSSTASPARNYNYGRHLQGMPRGRLEEEGEDEQRVQKIHRGQGPALRVHRPIPS